MDDLVELIEIVKYQKPCDVETLEHVLQFIEVLDEKVVKANYFEYHVTFSPLCRIKELIVRFTTDGFTWGFSTNERPKNRTQNSHAAMPEFLKVLNTIQFNVRCIYDPHYALHLAC